MRGEEDKLEAVITQTEPCRTDGATADLEVVRAETLADLTQIFAPGVNLCLCPQAPDPLLTAYLTAHAGRRHAGVRVVQAATRLWSAQDWPAAPGRDRLEDRVNFLIALYADLIGCPAVGLRIEILTRAMCPRFHTDRCGIRLLCTLRGPGTEWLASRCADRSRLGPGGGGLDDAESGLILDPAGIGQVPTGAIALLKGTLWPGGNGGIIHRSPAVPEALAPRVVLALDAIWDD